MSDSKLPKSRSDHLLQQFEGIRSLVKHLGLSDTNIPAKFGEVEQQFKSFNRMLADRDLFAKTFSPLGWVYYDNISSRLVADVVQMDLDEGEAALVRYHLDPSTLRLLKNRFQSRHYEAWAEHYDRAVERAGTEDYLSAVLLTIIIIDGMWITSTGKHPFSPGVNTPVFDSETCGPGGLTEGLALLGSMRRKLDMEPITVPFRHGIVHGLNPNFGNPLVAAKSFNLLQASVDYFDSRRDEAERVAKAAEEQRPVSWGELGRNLVRNAEEKRAIETWHARPPIRDMILAASDEPLKLAIDSPEAAAAQYLKLLMARNFGSSESNGGLPAAADWLPRRKAADRPRVIVSNPMDH